MTSKRSPKSRAPKGRRPEPRKSESRKTETHKTESRRPEPGKPEQPKGGQRKPGQRQPEQRKPEPRRPEQPKPDRRTPKHRAAVERARAQQESRNTITRRLSDKSNLDNLKKEAKRWLKALRENDDKAHLRFSRAYPGAPAEPKLRDVQHAIAKEHGLAGWTALKNQLEERALKKQLAGHPRTKKTHEELVAWFLENACPDHHVRGGYDHFMARHTAMRVLRMYPEVARDSIHTAVVCGDLNEVERILSERPEAASEKSSATAIDRSGVGGSGDLFKKISPKGWEPLLFLCFTRLPLEAANDNAVSIARTLLDRGANPNSYFMAGDSRYTPLVGVIGEGEEDRPPHPQRDALARLLLERGAEPYDRQVIYNVHFHGNVLWFLELMYEFSVKAGRKSDWDDPNWSMLNMGGYGSGARWHLNIAIQKDNLELAEWVLSHGASPNASAPRDPRLSRQTLYQDAMRNGFTEMAELLVRFGATRDAVEEAAASFSRACFSFNREDAMAILAEHPGYLFTPGPMKLAAERDRADVVAFLIEVGMSPDVEDENKMRPLHVAAYSDSPRVADLLIERGAEIDPRETNWGNTPLDFAVYAQKPRMIELLGRVSWDVWNLSFTGNVERLREVLSARPELAKIVGGGHTPLMWLPPDDEARALEIADLFLSHGANASIKNNQGQTAADRAERLGMYDVADLLRSRDRTSK